MALVRDSQKPPQGGLGASLLFLIMGLVGTLPVLPRGPCSAHNELKGRAEADGVTLGPRLQEYRAVQRDEGPACSSG